MLKYIKQSDLPTRPDLAALNALRDFIAKVPEEAFEWRTWFDTTRDTSEYLPEGETMQTVETDGPEMKAAEEAMAEDVARYLRDAFDLRSGPRCQTRARGRRGS